MLENLEEYYRKLDGKSEKDTELQHMSSPFPTTLSSTIFFSQRNKKKLQAINLQVFIDVCLAPLMDGS